MNSRWINRNARWIFQVLGLVFAEFCHTFKRHDSQMLFICCRFFLKPATSALVLYTSSFHIAHQWKNSQVCWPIGNWWCKNILLTLTFLNEEMWIYYVLLMHSYNSDSSLELDAFFNTWMICRSVLRGLKKYKDWTENVWKSSQYPKNNCERPFRSLQKNTKYKQLLLLGSKI